MKSFKEYMGNQLNSKKIFVFDFDATLCYTDCRTKLIKPNGEIEEVEYIGYNLKPGEKLDASDFEKLINPRLNNPVVLQYKSLMEKKENVIILTARKWSKPVEEFFNVFNLPKCKIFNEENKKMFLKKLIDVNGFTHITYFEDNDKYIKDAKSLKKEYPNVTFRIFKIGHNGLMQEV